MSKIRPLHLMSCAALSIGVIACSSSDDSSSGSSGGSGSCKSYDPCSMLTQSDVSTAIGGAVEAGTPSDTSSGAVEVKHCDWDSSATPPAGRANLLVRCYDKDTVDPAEVKNTLTGLYTNVVDVSGVGDGAVWGSGVIGSTMATIDGQLDVFVGENVYFIVGVGHMPDDATALAAAKQMAQGVVPKL